MVLKLLPTIEWPRHLTCNAGLDHGFIQVDDIPNSALPVLLAEHVASLLEERHPLSGSSPLRGGLIVELDGRRVLYPQCCGEIAEIASWERLLEPSFREAYVASESHPCPKAVRDGDDVVILCSNEEEPFQPPAAPVIRVSLASLGEALKIARAELDKFEQRLLTCQLIAGDEKLARKLVFGGDEPPPGNLSHRAGYCVAGDEDGVGLEPPIGKQ